MKLSYPFFTDTGTSATLMPRAIWEILAMFVCENLPSGSTCTGGNTILNCDLNQFPPVKIKVDSTFYSVPFDQLFTSRSVNTCSV